MRRMKSILKTVAVVFFVLPFLGLTARADDLVSVKPRVGVMMPRGEALENVSLLAGVQVDWAIDDTFGLRLGYEYVKADISDGSSLKLSRFPVLVTTPLKKDAPFKNFYVGFGGVATIGHYSDHHYPDVNKFGPAIMVGWRFSKHFNTELQYDTMTRYGRSYGGFSLCLTYDGF
jgi:hypothetical protein